jgi:3-(3-hydroxy-phenyl)propionate hydroxylase
MLHPGENTSSQFPEEELWPLLARWLKPGEGQLWRRAAYRFHGLVAREWRRDRILLAGDAVHMTPPFMSQGMMQGLRDAQNLDWKLEHVLRRGAPASLLGTYQQERRPHVTATTLAAMALGRVICERDPQRAAERDARLLAEQGGEVKTTPRQNLIPTLGDGLIAMATRGSGCILPQPFVHAGSFAGRLDDLTGAAVRVIATEPLTPPERSALLEALMPLGGVLVQLGESAPADGPLLRAAEDAEVLRPWIQGLGQRFAVARPDHYVYGTATSATDTVALLEQFHERLYRPAA